MATLFVIEAFGLRAPSGVIDSEKERELRQREALPGKAPAGLLLTAFDARAEMMGWSSTSSSSPGRNLWDLYEAGLTGLVNDPAVIGWVYGGLADSLDPESSPVLDIMPEACRPGRFLQAPRPTQCFSRIVCCAAAAGTVLPRRACPHRSLRCVGNAVDLLPSHRWAWIWPRRSSDLLGRVVRCRPAGSGGRGYRFRRRIIGRQPPGGPGQPDPADAHRAYRLRPDGARTGPAQSQGAGQHPSPGYFGGTLHLWLVGIVAGVDSERNRVDIGNGHKRGTVNCPRLS